MILLFLGEHTIVQESIACIKDAGNGKTSIWCIGQSAADGGFLVDMPYDEVMSLITDEEDSDAEEEQEEMDAGSGQASGRSA